MVLKGPCSKQPCAPGCIPKQGGGGCARVQSLTCLLFHSSFSDCSKQYSPGNLIGWGGFAGARIEFATAARTLQKPTVSSAMMACCHGPMWCAGGGAAGHSPVICSPAPTLATWSRRLSPEGSRLKEDSRPSAQNKNSNCSRWIVGNG